MTKMTGMPRKKSVNITATNRKGKKTGPGICLITAIRRARMRMSGSATRNILALRKKALQTDGSPCETTPKNDCFMWDQLKKNSRTVLNPGAR